MERKLEGLRKNLLKLELQLKYKRQSETILGIALKLLAIKV